MKEWHCKDISVILNEWDTDPSRGLSREEADRRRQQHGPNELRSESRTTAWTILRDQFRNVMILILLIAVILSVILGHVVEAVAISVIVLFAILLGFIQEYRAEKALEALQRMAAPTATVIRDSRESVIPSRELVPGDVIRLQSGNRVPADTRLVEAINLQTVESALTGESNPVEKQTDPLPDPRLTIGDRKNMAYAGTLVGYGRGTGVVVATGMNTEFGKITGMLQSVETAQTPLQINLERLGKVLAKAALVVVLILVAFGIVQGRPFFEMLIFGIALAVAVVPEALPAVVTISLAIGVQRMVRRNALIRRLPIVEALGSTSVICSDKTGTLTKNEMTIRQMATRREITEVSGAGYEPHGTFLAQGREKELSTEEKELLRGGTLCSDAVLVQTENGWEIQGDSTEGAFVVAAAKAGMNRAELEKAFPRIHEIPFSSETKRMTTLHASDRTRIAYSKGAPEVILNNCSTLLLGTEPVLLDEPARKSILEAAERMAGQALRVLAVSRKENADKADADRNMTFLGLAGMIDPPRPEAQGAIRLCDAAGIRPVMITGDHPLTAEAIARELGILPVRGKVVTGAELESMSDADLEDQVARIHVYARVSPSHKLRIVSAWQKQGEQVAMTGDGVNDAPALKKADIGIAMGITGTDVSKEVAGMILTDDNFASIVAAVEEGRGIYENIKKYLMYLISSNIGEILLMGGTTLLGLPLPLTAVQILYVNLATDGLPALALAVDPPDPDLMQRKPRNPRTGIFTRPVNILMIAGGIWSAAVNIGLFTTALKYGFDLNKAITMTFVSLVLIQFFKAYNYRSDRNSVLRKPFSNRWLNLAILWELLLLAALFYFPVFHGPFSISHLSWENWAVAGALALSVVPVLELVKWVARKGWLGPLD